MGIHMTKPDLLLIKALHLLYQFRKNQLEGYKFITFTAAPYKEGLLPKDRLGKARIGIYLPQ